jgi:hypothetical protein
MQPKAYISFAGFVMLMAGTWCPLLRPFGVINWNVYDLNKPFGIVLLLFSVVGIACIILKSYKAARILAWLSLVAVFLLFVAAQLKVNTTFSFIPFKSMAGYLTKLIKFKCGWFLMFAGPIASVLTTPKPVSIKSQS